jgi:hypothetical protein
MKAVILNTEKKHTNILCNDGSFRKIKRQSWHTAGKEFDYVPSSTSVVSKAAVILIAVLLTSLISAYALPYRTLALDINPSVTMSINRFGYVINAYGTDESGIKLVHNRKLIHKKVENALGLLVTEATAEGYLKPETDNVVLLSYNVPSEINYNRETDYIDKLVRTFEETTTRLNIPAQIVTQPIDTEIMEQAKANDVSPGRMALLNKLKEVDQDVTLEDIKDGPVKDIISAIQSNDKDYFMAKEAFADSETEKTPKGKNDENENNKDNKNNNKDNKSNVENNSKNNKKEDKEKNDKEKEDKKNNNEDKKDNKNIENKENKENKDNKNNKENKDNNNNKENKEDKENKKNNKKDNENKKNDNNGNKNNKDNNKVRNPFLNNKGNGIINEAKDKNNSSEKQNKEMNNGKDNKNNDNSMKKDNKKEEEKENNKHKEKEKEDNKNKQDKENDNNSSKNEKNDSKNNNNKNNNGNNKSNNKKKESNKRQNKNG